jgi:sec-independent protein translocase protein TatB
MFGIDSAELLIVAIVALVVIGPKDLPKVMRTVGEWVGRARGMAKHFRSGIDTMIRESELQEMEKKWKADNERIMREHPAVPADEMVEGAGYVPPPAPLGAGSAAPPSVSDAGRAPPPAPPRRVAPPPPRRNAPPPPKRDLP